jgi:hypothetical protein
VRAVVGALQEAAGMGYAIPSIALSMHGTATVADIQGAMCAEAAVAAAIAAVDGSSIMKLEFEELAALAAQLRIQISEIFEGRRIAANKILVVMLKDFTHTYSIPVAHFAVTGALKSHELDALIEYTLSNIKQRVGVVHHIVEESACSVFKLMPVAETGDGAITNLVRDERSTKRKTAGVASSVSHLPGSLREVAMETNQAVKQWKEAIEPLVLRALKLEGREQRSIDTEASKCAVKAQILAAWRSVALPISPTHSPHMYGWVAMKTPKVDTAGLRIYTGKYVEPDEDDEKENIKRARTEYDNYFFDLALDAAEAEFEAAAEAASGPALDFINSGASWDNSDTSTRYHRLTDAQRPFAAAAREVDGRSCSRPTN